MTTSSTSTVNSPWMRLVALLIAVLLAVGAYLVWEDTGDWVAPVQERAESLQTLTVSEDVAACVDKRFADIDRLVAEDMMSEEAAEEARTQARSLCYDRF